MTNLLISDDVVAGYLPGVDILNGISLRLAEGELVGIVGPNGAGKSTLIKAIFGLVSVRSGTVSLRGDDITGLAAHSLVAKGVGYVPQRDNVFQSLTVDENLKMGLYLDPTRWGRRLGEGDRPFPASWRARQPASGAPVWGESARCWLWAEP